MIDFEMPLRGRARRKAKVLPLVLAIVCAVLLGIAVTLQFSGWSAIVTEAGGGCGTHHGVSHGPCPRGTAWIIPISMIAVIGLVPATVVCARMAFPDRLRPAGYVGVIVLAGLGVVPGLSLFHWAHGATLKTA